MSKIFDESARCLSCKNPSCKAACPIGNNIPTFLNLVKNGDYAQAVKTVGHPFGEICGYVCPAERQCLGGCVLTKKHNGIPVQQIEKELFGSYPYKVERRGRELSQLKIAVVGGGVSGITFAVKTYEQGADVTLYERDKLLSTLDLIPSFRLPPQAVSRVINSVVDTFKVVFKDVKRSDLEFMQRQYDAVYVACGASANYALGISGQELAVDYKRFLTENIAYSNVIIVGGGNSAIDCARKAARSGSKVTVAYRRIEADMPAFEKETAAAKADGVNFAFNAAPVKLTKELGGLKLTLAETVSEGRGKLTVTDRVFDLTCDCVVSAVGSAFDKSVMDVVCKGEYLQYGNVYLGGDANCGKLVADAVFDGINVANLLMEKTRNKCL